MKTTKNKFSYYNYDKVLSFNAVYNFIVGPRGNGKTYGAKKKVIKAAIRTYEAGDPVDQFIYLRRYKTELVGRYTFFNDIEHEFPDYDFRVDGSVAQMATVVSRGDKKRHWIVIGFFFSLSNAQARKSESHPRVKWIIFDEFIIEKGALRYIENEADAFTNFFSTIDRNQDKTRVIFCANSVSIMNPYFLKYDIRPEEHQEFIRTAKGFIVVHFAETEEFGKEVFATRFGQFIEGTEYADYAVGAEFDDNHDRMIGTKTADAGYYCSIETKQGIFSVWINWDGPVFYIQQKLPKQQLMYTLLAVKMDEGKTLLVYSDKIMQYLRSGFKNGRVFFDSAQARNAFTEVFKR